MSKPECAREYITQDGKRLDCAGYHYYQAADGTVRFADPAGRDAYDHDQLMAACLKAAAAAVVGVIAVHILTD